MGKSGASPVNASLNVTFPALTMRSTARKALADPPKRFCSETLAMASIFAAAFFFLNELTALTLGTVPVVEPSSRSSATSASLAPPSVSASDSSVYLCPTVALP